VGQFGIFDDRRHVLAGLCLTGLAQSAAGENGIVLADAVVVVGTTLRFRRRHNHHPPNAPAVGLVNYPHYVKPVPWLVLSLRISRITLVQISF
jgi:hypothetical protein